MNIKLSSRVRSVLLALGSAIMAFLIFGSLVFASQSNSTFGYAWSTHLGLVRINDCISPTDCTSVDANAPVTASPYGLNIATTGTERAITGYAWSSNVGWISFNSDATSGCPASAPADTNCQARVIWGATGGDDVPVRGWARACAIFASGCSGALKPAYQTGGWDGWIALHDTNTADGVSFGVHFGRPSGSTNIKTLTNFGWGGDVAGWVGFSDLKLQTNCPAGSHQNPDDTAHCMPDSCPAGQHWDPGTSQCIPDNCPVGQHWDPTTSQCVPNNCPAGQHWDTTTQSCVPDNCPVGQHWDPTTSQCVPDSCPSGQHWDPTTSQCVPNNCPAGQHWDTATSQCVPNCPGDQINNPVNPLQCMCPAGSHQNPANPSQCIPDCPAGQHWDPTTSQCVPDGTGTNMCTNIPGTRDDPSTIEGQLYANGALQFPPYRHMSDGRCLCASGYVLRADYSCSKTKFIES